MSKIKVSIIIPAFNAQSTIQSCLESVLKSNYPKELLEVIVVDNNSTDKTAQFIANFSEVTYLFESKKNRSLARNKGAQKAKGQLLAFIDSDIVLNPNWINEMARAFEDSFVIGAAQGQTIPCNFDSQTLLNKYRFFRSHEKTKGTFNLLTTYCWEFPMINSSACMYLKEAFEFVEGFDPNLERHEDIDLSKRVSLAGYTLKSVFTAKAFVQYHGRGWPSYFSRAFREGITKRHYNAKWQLLHSKINQNKSPPSQKKPRTTKFDNSFHDNDENIFDKSRHEAPSIRVTEETNLVLTALKIIKKKLLALIKKPDLNHTANLLEFMLKLTGLFLGRFLPSITKQYDLKVNHTVIKKQSTKNFHMQDTTNRLVIYENKVAIYNINSQEINLQNESSLTADEVGSSLAIIKRLNYLFKRTSEMSNWSTDNISNTANELMTTYVKKENIHSTQQISDLIKAMSRSLINFSMFFPENQHLLTMKKLLLEISAREMSSLLSLGQLKSKQWLIDTLNQHRDLKFDEIKIIGGWLGILAYFLHHKIHHKTIKITSYDIDARVKPLATILNPNHNFNAIKADALELQYTKENENILYINTSCEHMDYVKWRTKLPKGSLVILQNNDFFAEETHISCVSNLSSFRDELKLATVIFEGELELESYKRFMIIGVT